MSRLLPFLRCLWLALLPALAQAQPAAYLFSLGSEKPAVAAGPWQVTRVLDARSDRSRLGPVRRGLGNGIASANFSRPLPAEVLAYVGPKAPAGATARPVVLRVLALAVGEDLRAGSEKSEAELVADFLVPQPDSTYRVLLLVGEMVRRGGLDVTGQHAANIAELLQRALTQLAAAPATPADSAAGEVLTAAQARAGQRGAGTRRWPAQGPAPAARGLYRTFADFHNHASDPGRRVFAVAAIARPSARERATGEVRAEYLDPDAQLPSQPIREVWGLSDGTHDYISYQNHFYPLLPTADGRSFTFQGPPPYDPQKAQDLALGSVVGGAVGAAVVASHYPTGSVAVTYEVHLATGRIMPSEVFQTDEQGFANAPDSAVVYLYRRPAADAGQALTVLLAGKPIATLAPSHYLRLSWADRRRELPLCVQLPGTAATCRSFVPDFTVATYLECRAPAAGKPVAIKPTTVKEGQWQVKRRTPVAAQ